MEAIEKVAGESLPKKLDLAAIEARMFECENQIDIPVEHIFSGGVYIRQVTIPKGTLVMGKRHRFSTCNMLLKGTLAVYVEEGKPPMTITAPTVFTSEPFAKKFAYCIEDAVFVNVIPTDLTDPDEIEEKRIIPEQEYIALKGDESCLLSQ
jgi:hypothetical protein